jgi:MOSC domain-containing protein YiiM
MVRLCLIAGRDPGMKIVSVNVGLPRRIRWKDREVVTSIFKSPVAGPLMLYRLNLDGDRQSDLENHGGRSKAVYAYPAEHYETWRRELPGTDLSWGAFGENFTTQGIQEEHTYIGDHFRIGRAVVMVTQPRIPCYKLGLRLGRDDIVKRFLASNRSGIYFSVVEEGLVAIADKVERIKEDEERISVVEINRAYANGGGHLSIVRRAVQHPVLPPGLREHFLRQLASAEEAS